jgi:hypothetical protein
MTLMSTAPSPPLSGWPPPYGGQPPPMPIPPAAAPPPTKRCRWRRWMVAVGVTTTAAAIAVGAFAVGRGTAPIPTPATETVQVPGQPNAQPFSPDDAAWCREYNVITTRIVDETRVAGLPSNVSGRDLPASGWTGDEQAANQRFVEYLHRWDAELAGLKGRDPNPVLKLLIDGLFNSDRKLAVAIADGSYTPSDYQYFRDGSAASGGLGQICERLQP